MNRNSPWHHANECDDDCRSYGCNSPLARLEDDILNVGFPTLDEAKEAANDLLHEAEQAVVVFETNGLFWIVYADEKSAEITSLYEAS